MHSSKRRNSAGQLPAKRTEADKDRVDTFSKPTAGREFESARVAHTYVLGRSVSELEKHKEDDCASQDRSRTGNPEESWAK